ncbi:MAG: 16S rRNA (guanine(966)-N(2))-methyltransferase RsmD, partial [Candidatus Omnitrophica bacterium]|nr:16S rRNA (guanine(966)-N(2))-methyltransferase RsmD [Candidatus Omnitrophota bacterium]
IGGEFRGRKITQPDLKTVRPTKDRIREAVFNVIAAEVPDAKILDLFAGSGAYGLEAISRGAVEAVFVELDRKCVSVIKDNIKALGAGERTRISVGDAGSLISSGALAGEKFDIVFADPPYSRGLAKNLLITVSHYDILSNSGLLVIEHHRQESLPDEEGVFILLKRKSYSDISVSFYKKNG